MRALMKSRKLAILLGSAHISLSTNLQIHGIGLAISTTSSTSNAAYFSEFLRGINFKSYLKENELDADLDSPLFHFHKMTKLSNPCGFYAKAEANTHLLILSLAGFM